MYQMPLSCTLQKWLCRSLTQLEKQNETKKTDAEHIKQQAQLQTPGKRQDKKAGMICCLLHSRN